MLPDRFPGFLPDWFHDLFYRLCALLRRDAMETDLDEELRFHFDLQVEKYINSGMTRKEAMRQTRLDFGGLEQIKEDVRQSRGLDLLETTWQDIRYGLRMLAKNRSFTIIAVLTLALGIGATTAVFSVVNTVLLKPLPYPNADRVVVLWCSVPVESFDGMDEESAKYPPWYPSVFHILTQTQTVFEHVSAFNPDKFRLTKSGDPELLTGAQVSAGFFETLGVAPQLGRVFTANEDRPGQKHLVILSYALWVSRFAADANIVGRTINLNGDPYTVLGVMPENFVFPNAAGMPKSVVRFQQTQIWVPLALPPDPKGLNNLGVIAALKPDIRKDQLQRDLTFFKTQDAKKFPYDSNITPTSIPLRQQTIQHERQPLLLLFSAVSVVLLIACSNVAGLVLNYSIARRKEFALRGALGASRSRLIRQLMTESLLLTICGGFVGTILGTGSLRILKHFDSGSIPHLKETALDSSVIFFVISITLIVGILCGLIPALSTTRLKTIDALKEGSQQSGQSRSALKVRNLLLVSQVTFATVLLIASGLLVRTFYNLLHVEKGFDMANISTFDIPLQGTKYLDVLHRLQVYKQILQRLRSMQDIDSAGFASTIPMGEQTPTIEIDITERPNRNNNGRLAAYYVSVSDEYLQTLGAKFIHGRDISKVDTSNSTRTVVINDFMAKQCWPEEDPLGKQIKVIWGAGSYPRTVVGVISDNKQDSLREVPFLEIYVPAAQQESPILNPTLTMQYVIRSQSAPASIRETINRAVHEVDPDLPIANLRPLTAQVNQSINSDRLSMQLMGSLGAVALILTLICLYGIVSYSVAQRSTEIGLRLAFGVERKQLLWMILRQGISPVLIGVGIGVLVALGIMHWMASFLYGVQPYDPISFMVATLLVFLAGLFASLWPAWKAAKIAPVAALRYE